MEVGQSHRGKAILRDEISIVRRVGFWAKVGNFAGDGCWPYLGKLKNRRGYGIVSMEHGGKRYAHRLAWALTHGHLQGGACVLHKCDNPECVNPGHLFLGTIRDNNKDMKRKGRARGPYLKGERCPTSKLTDAQVREIKRRLIAGGETLAQIARSYGVVPQTIGWISIGKRWTHIEEVEHESHSVA